MSEMLRNNKPLLIIIAGLVGGLGAWVWALAVGPEPLLKDPAYAIPSYMFLGAIAGFIGVYLVAKTDPAQTAHAIAFSLVCGVFWGPVISGAEAIVTKKQTQDAVAAVAAQHAEIEKTQSAMVQQAKDLQDSAAAVARQAEEVKRAKDRLEDAVRSTPHLNPNLGRQLEQIETKQIHQQLDRSSAKIDRINQQLKTTRLTPLNPRLFPRKE